ncbi:MAG: histidine kinase [Sulfobacillus benefaciens]|uniref:Histidine kinase n=1 Tax=Sulfobacillus benefaciens TaxID=453960 RepID=A0A2T2XDD7_9FIRM|nr:MAG: histidine kinase [Sulfobacillus benefaciens]
MVEQFKRRTPEEILEQIRRMSRGRHRIYLGAAPGVGKTYTMLSDARGARDQGVDVVVGIVDTHGREETAEMVHGLEVMPLRMTLHKGLAVGEIDVAAIMKRAPDLVLVDELAHTNPEDASHPKRYQDVEDLLASGIHVWSTVNIQHMESLNDLVRQITGVRVRETIPDTIIQNADEVRLIDLTPEALVDRLKRGKIYQRNIDQALQNFFRVGNLTALRELALRAVADDTDDRLESYMHRHAIEGPWPTQDRIMVAVTPSPNGERLLRRGYRTARRLRAEFYVVVVRPEGHPVFATDDETRLTAHLTLAEQMGAQIVQLQNNRVAHALVQFAREHHITQMVMGESLRTRWQEIWRGSVINEVLRLTSNIDILVVGHERKWQ